MDAEIITQAAAWRSRQPAPALTTQHTHSQHTHRQPPVTTATQYTHRQPKTTTQYTRQYTHRQPTTATQYRQPTTATRYIRQHTYRQPTSATQYTHRTPVPTVTATTNARGSKEETLQEQDHEIETRVGGNRAHTGDKNRSKGTERDTNVGARNNKTSKQKTKAIQAL